PLNPEHRREPGIRVDVHLREGDRAVARRDLLLEHRCESPTGSAPCGPEVHDDRNLVRAVDDQFLEGGLGDVHVPSNAPGASAQPDTTTSAPQPATRAASTCSSATPASEWWLRSISIPGHASSPSARAPTSPPKAYSSSVAKTPRRPVWRRAMPSSS